VQQPMTSTDLLVVGVIAAPYAPAARLYEKNAAFGVTIVYAAFTTQIEVMMTTTVARRMTPGRENFWIRIVIVFILFGFILCWFPSCGSSWISGDRARRCPSEDPQPTNVFSAAEDSLKRRVTRSRAFLLNPVSSGQLFSSGNIERIIPFNETERNL